jgi:hypothetical protein
MMKKYKLSLGVLLTPVAVSMLLVGNAAAATFNPDRIIDDAVFDNVGSMTAAQIDAFLNQFPSSCISTNHGFQAADPTGYNPTSGFLYGNNVSAGRVIYDATQAYNINPQVLLTTLQKEQSLVTGNAGCSTLQYAAATGYGCPDGGTTHSYSGVNLYTLNGQTVTSVSGTCVNTSLKVGFSQQVIRAAWLLKFGEQRSEGNINWAIIKGSWDNSDDLQSCYGGPMTQGTWQRCPSGGASYYDGYTTIDGTAVHMDNGATASLYWYTPHLSGNQNFDTIFEQTFNFGSLTADEAYYVSQSAYPSIKQGENATAFFEFENNSSTQWYDSTSAPGGNGMLNLATSNPLNRASQFGPTWWGFSNRPAINFAAVYESDGTTLAASQHVAQPGQIVKYQFTFTVSVNTAPGTYREWFQPVLDGSPNWNVGGMGYLDVTVTPAVFQASPLTTGQSISLTPGVSQTITFKFENTGDSDLKDSTGASVGGPYTNLATSNPMNRASQFALNWWGFSNRPAINFAAVYESDGTTLAANQHVAQPGQIFTYTFPVVAYPGQPEGSYTEWFQPVMDGAQKWGIGAQMSLTITVTNGRYVPTVYSQASNPTIKQGNSAGAFFEFKNSGTAPWYDSTSAPNGTGMLNLATANPMNRASQFALNWWGFSNRPAINFAAVYESDGTTLAANQHVAQPGQIVKYQFTLGVPSNMAPGTYREWFQPVLDGSPNWNVGGMVYLDVTVTP